MRACPVCGIELTRTKYEGFPVWECAKCCGRLAARSRVKAIERTRRKGREELVREAVGEKGADTTHELRCPKCHGPMRREPLHRYLDVRVDVCRSCDVIWFDGGELALLQLAYEATPGALRDAEFRERIETMSPERRARFEDNLRRLEAGPSDLGDAFAAGVVEGVLCAHHRRHRPR